MGLRQLGCLIAVLAALGGGCAKRAAEQAPQTTTSLHQAAKEGDLARVKSLIAAGASIDAIDESGWTPLQMACDSGQNDVVHLLIAEGADPEARSGRPPYTPLSLAVFHGTEMVELLIAGGVDINARDTQGRTALHLAASGGFIRESQLLIASGASINVVDRHGETPLHYTLHCPTLDVARLLVAEGADVDAKNGAGETPLHCAIKHGRLGMAELLLASGADVNSTTVNGWTPLDWAYRERCEFTELLRAAGGKTRKEIRRGLSEDAETSAEPR